VRARLLRSSLIAAAVGVLLVGAPLVGLGAWSVFRQTTSDLSRRASDVQMLVERGDAPLPELEAQIESELQQIFASFIRSSAYSEVASARILGREVPLVMPWNGQIMEGIIDLIYEKNGLLYLADYKTDRIAKAELSQGVERYRPQAEIYSKAVEQSLGRSPAAFKVIFLRLGKAVELVPQEPNQELWLF